jgi:hypothetical protein
MKNICIVTFFDDINKVHTSSTYELSEPFRSVGSTSLLIFAPLHISATPVLNVKLIIAEMS